MSDATHMIGVGVGDDDGMNFTDRSCFESVYVQTTPGSIGDHCGVLTDHESTVAVSYVQYDQLRRHTVSQIPSGSGDLSKSKKNRSAGSFGVHIDLRDEPVNVPLANLLPEEGVADQVQG